VNNITYLAWYSLIITALSTLIVVFGSKKTSLDRFLIALFNTPVIVFAYNYLFNK